MISEGTEQSRDTTLSTVSKQHSWKNRKWGDRPLLLSTPSPVEKAGCMERAKTDHVTRQPRAQILLQVLSLHSKPWNGTFKICQLLQFLPSPQWEMRWSPGSCELLLYADNHDTLWRKGKENMFHPGEGQLRASTQDEVPYVLGLAEDGKPLPACPKSTIISTCL